MEISSTPKLPETVTITRSIPEIRNWQVGQVLKATVASVPEAGIANLKIGNQTLLAQLQFPVQTGQKLTLEVTQLGNLPQLRAVIPATVQKLVEQAIRHSIPKQHSHNQLLANLLQLGASQKQPANIPPKITESAKKLLASLPDVKQMSTPQGVRKAIENSGIFLEPKITRTTRAPYQFLQSDFKANLLRLQAAVTQTQAQTTAQTGNAPVTPSSTASTPANKGATQVQTATQTTTRTATRTDSALPTPTQVPPAAKPQSTVQSVLQATTPATTTQQANAQVPTQPSKADSTSPPPLPQGTTAPDKAPARQDAALTNREINARTTNATPTSLAQGRPAGVPGNVPESSPGTQATATRADVSTPAAAFLNFQQLRQPVPQGRAAPNMSFHESLFRLMTSLIKDTEASLARIQLNQLNSQGVEGDQKPGWVFEIPIRRENGSDIFHFHIEPDEEKNRDNEDQQDNQWNINMAFELEELGPVHSRISLRQDEVSIAFWAVNQETNQIFNQHLSQLKNDLEQSGLQVKNINCMQGTPPSAGDTSLKKLLDEKA
jgi:hypothetical protein